MTLNIVASSSPHRNINNEEFLQAIFGPDWQDAWVTGFMSDPDDTEEELGPEAAGRWAGGPWRTHGRLLTPSANTYFSISLNTGRRSQDCFRACGVLVLDDIGSLVDEREPLGALGTPSYRISTSLRSEQWGYRLWPLETNLTKVRALIAALQVKKLTDAKGNAVRWARLPVGMNRKKKYGAPRPHVWLPV